MILFLGSGFIGNALSAHLERTHVAHRIVTRHVDSCLSDQVLMDIRDLREDSEVLESVETVVYFAHSSVPYSSMQDIRSDAEENILNAISLFEIFAKRGIRVIYVSSGGSVYGNHESTITESSLPSPVSAYGVAKYAIEGYLRLYHHNRGIQYDILRFSNVYGVGQQGNRPQGIIAALARAFIRKEKFEVWGDGTGEKDYLYIDDAVTALAKVLDAAPSNDTFNVSYGRSTSIREVIGLFEDLTASRIGIAERPAFDFDVRNVHLDNTRFKRAYGWEPLVDMEAGIRRTIEWLTRADEDRGSCRSA